MENSGIVNSSPKTPVDIEIFSSISKQSEILSNA